MTDVDDILHIIMLILEYCALSAGSKPIDEVPKVTYQPGKTRGRGYLNLIDFIISISISAGIWIC